MEFIITPDIDPDATVQPDITPKIPDVAGETSPEVPPDAVATVEVASAKKVVEPAIKIESEPAAPEVAAPKPVVEVKIAPRVHIAPRQQNPLVKEVEGYFVDEKVMGLWEGLSPEKQAEIRHEGEQEAAMVAEEVQTGMKNPKKVFAGVRKFYDLFPSPSKDRSYYTQQTWLAFKKAQDKAEELKLSGQNQL